MNPQMRRDVFRAVLPALAGVALLAVLWWAEVWALEQFVGDDFWFQRIGAIPHVFSASDGETFPSMSRDGKVFFPWVLACAFFVACPLVAFMFSRGKAAHILSTALLLGVITLGCVNVVSFSGWVMWFNSMPVTLVKLVTWSWPGVAWIFALSLGGAAIGIAVSSGGTAIEIVVSRIARVVGTRAGRRRGRECR